MKMEIKRLMSDIDYAAKQVKKLVEVLGKLQANCLDTAGKLDKVLDDVKGKIKGRSTAAKKQINSFEAKIRALRCDVRGWWIFKSWNCTRANRDREHMKGLIAKYRVDFALATEMLKKMKYFDGLKKTAALLVDEASKELDLQKKFASKLDTSKKALAEAMNKENLDMLSDLAELSDPGDENPAMDSFVEGLIDVQNDLLNICSKVEKSAVIRKDKFR